MSKYIIINANTNSEWDPVSFSLIELTKGHLLFLQQAQQEAIAVQKKWAGFGYLTYYGDNSDFYIDEEELPKGIVPKEDEPIVVDIKSAKIKKLTQPEQVIKNGHIRIYPGSVVYVAYGKHTDEEYWTGMIPFEKIFK